MKPRPYQNKDRLQISFTRKQREMLQKEKEDTGNTMTSMVRQAVNEYFERRMGQKLKNMSGNTKRKK